MRRQIRTKASVDKDEEKKRTGETDNLRPQVFKDYIGQEKVKNQILMAVKSAMIRNEPVDHILLYGPPGLGKTTMAHIIAHTENVPMIEVSGPSIEKTGDIAATLMSGLKDRSIVFIDEIHRMDKKAEEMLYSAMEDGYLNIIMGQGEQQRNIHLDLPRFTLIGATTKAGMISAPLRDRFGLKCKMEFYTPDELAQITKNTAEKLGVSVTDEQALVIAKASRGTPRVANGLMKRVRDYAVVTNNGKVTDKEVREALKLAEIDENGLSAMDLKLLELLKDRTKPVGLNTMADMLGEDPGTIEDLYEPYLLKQHMIEKTARGRIITFEGQTVLQQHYMAERDSEKP